MRHCVVMEKTFKEKKKMLPPSIFSFSKNVKQIHYPFNDKFQHYSHLQPFPKQVLVFTCLHYKSLENTVGKGEIARKEQFLLFPQCFLNPFTEFSTIFIKFEIVICKLF